MDAGLESQVRVDQYIACLGGAAASFGFPCLGRFAARFAGAARGSD